MSNPTPFDPRLERYRPVTRGLQVALGVCAALAGLAVVLPDDAARWAGGGVVAVLIGAPMVRVIWLVQRWFRRGDLRYALVGCGVLSTIVVGVTLAALGV